MATKHSQMDIYIGQSLGMLISVPSAALYLVECLVIVRNWKQFNSSFYKLFLLSACNNLFMNFGPSFIYARLIRLGWSNDFYLNSPVWMPNLLCFTMYYNYHCENLATIFTLIHRLTVIANPLGYEQQWHTLLPLSAICIFIGPFLFTYRLLIWPLIFTVNPDNSVEIVLNSTALTEKPLITNYMTMLATSLGYLLVNLLLNLVVYLLYRNKQAKFSLSSDKSSRLLVYAIAIFMAQLLLCLFWLFLTIQTLGKIFFGDFNLVLANQYVWMSDIRTVAFPSWFLLWASAELNERVRKWIPWIPSFSRMTPSSENGMIHGAGGARISVAPAWSLSSSNSANAINRSQQAISASLARSRSAAPIVLPQMQVVEQRVNRN